MSRYLEVVGTGAATAPPDRLDLHVGLSTVRPDVGTAMSALGELAEALGTALRGAGVAGEDLQTTGSNVGEEHGPDQALVGFRAGQDLRVRLRDPRSVGDVLAAATGAVGDAFRLGYLVWAVEDDRALASVARDAAFEDARTKAEQLAVLAGGTLGGIRRVVEGGTGSGSPLLRLAAGKADSAFHVEPGECRVEVSLTVRWSLDR